MAESILQEAQRIIHGDRSKSYGHPRENFQNIADVWSAYKHVEFTTMDVGLMMVLLKVARLENGEYHRDSVTDIAGYAGTLERIFEEPEEKTDPYPLADWEKELLADAMKPISDEDKAILTGKPVDLDKPKRRVWDHISHIPDGVTVVDRAGDFWKRVGEDVLLWFKDETEADADITEPADWMYDDKHNAPYAEVVA